jgi:hypothetical protein
MQVCRHCGKDNEESATLCVECGLDLGESPLRRATRQVWQRSRFFFRRRPASILLLLLAIFYLAIAAVNIGLGGYFSRRGESEATRQWYVGTSWNIVVAVLCVVARQMIQRQTRIRLLSGALAGVAAFFVVVRTWVGALLVGRNPFPVVEALLIWLPLLYAIVYAYSASRYEAESDAGAASGDLNR